jgi:predicted PurR-regulated permease PerM
MSDWVFFRRVLIVLVVAVMALQVWRLAQTLLLLFGAVLIGLLLSGASDYISRKSGLPRVASLALVTLLIVGLVAGIFAMFGAQISIQVADLVKRLPDAVNNLEQRLGLSDVSGRLWEQIQSNTGNILSQVTSLAGGLLGVVTNIILLSVSGVFLAADPDLYRRGALRLVPAGQRPPLEETMDYASAALRQWLLSQLISVMIVGVSVTVGLYFLGVPSPLALGLIAAVTAFVPLLGPIIGAIPAVLLALTIDLQTALWTIGLFLLIQQVESNMIMPVIQRRMVDVPPVVTLFAIVAIGGLFGLLGVLFAAPLTVLLFVAVAQLYVRGLLGEPATVPGERQVREEEARERRETRT